MVVTTGLVRVVHVWGEMDCRDRPGNDDGGRSWGGRLALDPIMRLYEAGGEGFGFDVFEPNILIERSEKRDAVAEEDRDPADDHVLDKTGTQERLDETSLQPPPSPSIGTIREHPLIT